MARRSIPVVSAGPSSGSGGAPPNKWVQLQGNSALAVQREEHGKRQVALQLILGVRRH